MKRSTTNRRNAGSAMLETLESRKMFCNAPLDILVYEVMDKSYVAETPHLRDGSQLADAERTSGPRAIGSDTQN